MYFWLQTKKLEWEIKKTMPQEPTVSEGVPASVFKMLMITKMIIMKTGLSSPKRDISITSQWIEAEPALTYEMQVASSRTERYSLYFFIDFRLPTYVRQLFQAFRSIFICLVTTF